MRNHATDGFRTKGHEPWMRTSKDLPTSLKTAPGRVHVCVLHTKVASEVTTERYCSAESTTVT